MHNLNTFTSFSFGPSNCVGKNLALREMKVLLCYMMQRLDLRFADGWDSAEFERYGKDRYVAEIGRLPVIIKGRE